MRKPKINDYCLIDENDRGVYIFSEASEEEALLTALFLTGYTVVDLKDVALHEADISEAKDLRCVFPEGLKHRKFSTTDRGINE